MNLKFGLPSYFLSGKYASEGQNYNVKEAQDTIIGVVHQVTEFNLWLITHDMLNAMMILRLVNQFGVKLSERWDFSSRKNLLDKYGSIEKKPILLCREDCLCWIISNHDQ